MTLVRSMTLMKWNKRNKIFKCHVVVVILIMCTVRLCQQAELFSRDIPRELRSPKPKQRVLKLTVVCLQGFSYRNARLFLPLQSSVKGAAGCLSNCHDYKSECNAKR